MKKSIGTSLLSAVLASTLVANAAAVAVTDFTDVKSADWYYSTVDYATKNNLMVGISDKLFAPNDNLTRAMAVVVLGRMAKAKVDDTKETAFTDVPAGHWSAGSVSWASEKKIVNGYGNGLFGRDDNITRQDAATIIGRYLTSINYKKPTTTTTTTNTTATTTTPTFTDADQIAEYAKDAVKQCAELGLITGYPDGSFQPTKLITRAEYAAVSERLNKAVIAATTPTPGGGGGGGGGTGGTGGGNNQTTQNVTRTKTTTYQASLKGAGAGYSEQNLLSEVYTLTQTREGTTKGGAYTNNKYADFTATSEYGKAQGDATLGTLLVDIMSDGETKKLINNYYNGKDGNGNYLSNSALGKVLGYSLNTTVSGQKARIEITPEGVVSISVIADVTQLNKTDVVLGAVEISIEEMNALAEKLNNGDALTLEEINTLYALSDQAKEVQTKDDTTLTDKIEEIKQDLPQNVQDMVGNLSGQEIKDKAQEYDNQLTTVKESIKDNLGIVQDANGNLVKVDDPTQITMENGKYVVPNTGTSTLIDSNGTVQITEQEKEIINKDLADKNKVNTKVEPIKVTLDITSYFNTGSQLDTKYQDQAQRAKNSLLTQLSESGDGAVATAIDGLLKYGNPATNKFVKVQNKDVSIDVAYDYGTYAADIMAAFKTLMDAVGTDGTDVSVARQKVVADWVVNNADNLLLGITVNTDEVSKLMASAGIFENKDTGTLTKVTIDLSAQKVLDYMLDLVQSIFDNSVSVPTPPSTFDGQHTFNFNIEQKTMEEKDALKK